jgi:methionyl-tRNA formyltransferase
VAGKIKPQPQPAAGVTYAAKIKKQDGEIIWSRPARAIWNQVRGLFPWPGAFTFLTLENKRHLLKIHKGSTSAQAGPSGEIVSVDKTGIVVACGAEALRIEELQLEGGRRLAAAQFLAGHKLSVGQKLG